MKLRAAVTLVVLVLLLVGGSLLGWRLLTTAPTAAITTPSPSCTDRHLRSGTTLHAREVTVNVYNAGSISGLAATTMQSLTQRGFGDGVVDDAPAGVTADNVLVRYPDPKAPEARLVAAQFDGDVVVRKRPHGGAEGGVDVIVGNHYAGLASKAKTSLAVKGRTHVCVPVTPTP